jgi:hypothetical protein
MSIRKRAQDPHRPVPSVLESSAAVSKTWGVFLPKNQYLSSWLSRLRLIPLPSPAAETNGG